MRVSSGHHSIHGSNPVSRGGEVVNTSLADVVKGADSSYITAHFGKGIGGEQMKTIGYDVTDEVDGKADNGNFHGEFVSLKNRVPLPPDNPKRMASLKKSSVDFINEHGGKRPFFLMVSHYAVHVPHAAQADLIEKYRRLPRGKYCKDDDYLPASEISKSKKNQLVASAVCGDG